MVPSTTEVANRLWYQLFPPMLRCVLCTPCLRTYCLSYTYAPTYHCCYQLEDNSAVVTVSNDESAYLKKCKHFIMVVNYVREKLELGLIQVIKIKGELNNADLHTKKQRDKSFICNESRQHPRLSSEARHE